MTGKRATWEWDQERAVSQRDELIGKEITCPDCKGLGETEKRVTCERCHGTGKVEMLDD